MINPSNHINIVLDLETLGLSEDAAILQIGCAVPFFDQYKIPGIDPTFETTISYEVALSSEFAKDHSTLEWWEKQPNSTRLNVFSGQNSYEDALDQFKFWLETIKAKGLTPRIWGRGPEFDNRLLEYTLSCYNMGGLWSFRDNHSLRTLEALFPVNMVEVEDEVKHTALGDARYEARMMHQIKMTYASQLYRL